MLVSCMLGMGAHTSAVGCRRNRRDGGPVPMKCGARMAVRCRRTPPVRATRLSRNPDDFGGSARRSRIREPRRMHDRPKIVQRRISRVRIGSRCPALSRANWRHHPVVRRVWRAVDEGVRSRSPTIASRVMIAIPPRGVRHVSTRDLAMRRGTRADRTPCGSYRPGGQRLQQRAADDRSSTCQTLRALIGRHAAPTARAQRNPLRRYVDGPGYGAETLEAEGRRRPW